MAEIASITVPQGVAPLEPLLGSPARLRIARMLSRLPDKEFTGRELARLLKLSHSSVQDAMRIFVERGVAVRRIVGRSNVYRANEESFLYRSLRDLFRKEGSLTEEVLDSIRRTMEPKSLTCLVFGSASRGKSTRDSDLDVLVVATDRAQAEDELSTLGLTLLRRYGVRLDAKVLTPSQLRAKGLSGYLRAARSEGVRISGEPLERVIKTA